jgi:hypothetical protein
MVDMPWVLALLSIIIVGVLAAALLGTLRECKHKNSGTDRQNAKPRFCILRRRKDRDCRDADKPDTERSSGADGLKVKCDVAKRIKHA